MTEPVKVKAPMATPMHISISACAWMCADDADAEGFRRIERAGRHEHRGKADQRVERRDQLRHVGHLDRARHKGADAAAERDAADDQHPAEPVAMAPPRPAS